MPGSPREGGSVGLPKVSVVIPVFNHAGYIAEAVQSVLEQSYQDFELVIVDDASVDGTAEVVSRFKDPRIISVVHERNYGPAAARNSGIRASSGELVAFLDADDLFTPAKLDEHVLFLDRHPDVDVTYNSRFELNYSSRTIRNLVRPPANVTLRDLVLGFPFSTSDMVLRREKLLQAGLFEDDLIWSEELGLNCKLALSGCRFARVDRALNYRRFESGRKFGNLAGKYESAVRSLETIFSDPRFPPDILDVRSEALANIQLVYGLLALEQDEMPMGQRLIRDAVRLHPAFLSGTPCELLLTMLRDSIADDGRDHDAYLRRMISRLPDEFGHLSNSVDWAIGQGFVLKACRAVLWGRLEDGDRYIHRAVACRASLEDFVVDDFVYQMLSYQAEYGAESAEAVFQKFTARLQKLGYTARLRRLEGDYLVNRAFQCYETGGYRQVPGYIVRAILRKPEFLINRGVVVTFIRSIFHGGIENARFGRN